MHIFNDYGMIRLGDSMKRNIENRLVAWKDSNNKKPLIIKGARQVGKTFSIRRFAQENYDHVVEINFERQLEFVKLFESTRDPEEILAYLKLTYMGVPFDDNTLLFLDEIQASSDALTALKFMAETFPTDIICSGSVLGVAIASSTSFPVGYVETWDMFPLSFIEFIKAYGVDDQMIQSMETALVNYSPLPDVIHNKMNEIYKDYVVVGGMPEVVQAFVKNKSYREALIIQRRIVSDYSNDMAKYALGSDRIKTRECFESIPLQLAKDNKKFQYSVVKKGYNARYFDSSLRWLEDSGLVIKVNKLNQVKRPLDANKVLSSFKIYMFDTGLLISQFDESDIKELLSGNLGIYKGAIFENIVAQTFRHKDKKTYYYEPTHHLEIDFITYFEGDITPFEVKSSIKTSSISFNNFIDKEKPKKSFRISMKNMGKDEGRNAHYIPFYLLELLLDHESTLLI